jgi:transcriptional regulator with XRE-family HTH domain
MEHTSSIAATGGAIVALRREMGLSQTEFGAVIGLASKSKVSEIETSGRASLPVALKIEELSVAGGAPRIDAATLNDDVARARARLAAQSDEVAECFGGDAAASGDGDSAVTSFDHGDSNSGDSSAPSTGQVGEMSRHANGTAA